MGSGSSQYYEVDQDSKIYNQDVKYIWVTLDDFMYSRLIDDSWGFMVCDVKAGDLNDTIKSIVDKANRDGYGKENLVIRKCEMANGDVYENKTFYEMNIIVE